MTSTADPTDTLDADAKAQLQRKREIEDFKWLVGHKQGRRLLWRLLSMTGVFTSSMTGNSQTFFNEGRRDIGLQLMAEVNEHSLEAFVQMMKEAKADE